MSMFDDNVYKDMDCVSKMIEPFQYDVNDELSKFPDKLEIELSTIDSAISGWGRIYAYDVLSDEARKLGLNELADKSSEICDNDFFSVAFDEDIVKIEYNTKTQEASGKVYLVKNKIAFSDEDLEKMRKKRLNYLITSSLNCPSIVSKPRINEIADIFGATAVKSERALKNKLVALANHMDTLLDDKTLDIRDWSLVEKFHNWIFKYVTEGNLPAINNITRIKIMTHEKRPIYSIEEVS